SENPVELELFINENLPHVTVDTVLMQTAITQIVENAVSNTEKGNILISVSVNDRVNIIVEDSGCGIPLQYQNDIFSPFFQANSEQLGLGLGLTIVRKILQLHKGQLEISLLTHGTKVTISFPLA